MATKVKAKKARADSAKRATKVIATRAGRTSTSRLSAKNQVTVPVDIIRAMGLHVGDELQFTLNNTGFIELSVVGENRLLSFAGKYGDVFKDFDLTTERHSWNR